MVGVLASSRGRTWFPQTATCSFWIYWYNKRKLHIKKSAAVTFLSSLRSKYATFLIPVLLLDLSFGLKVILWLCLISRGAFKAASESRAWRSGLIWLVLLYFSVPKRYYVVLISPHPRPHPVMFWTHVQNAEAFLHFHSNPWGVESFRLKRSLLRVCFLPW